MAHIRYSPKPFLENLFRVRPFTLSQLSLSTLFWQLKAARAT